MSSANSPDEFATRLLAWFDKNGRHDLPWQDNPTPYRVWVSEIMLQQTQVTTVIPFYERFMVRFASVAALAAAPLDDVLHHWTGLGYYARARNLHKAANVIVDRYAGQFPQEQTALEALPGIGRSTAGAIRAIAMGQVATILDGNVKRVLARFHAVAGYPGTTATANTLWQHADAHTPLQQTGDYTQAIMDLGATLCTRSRPACDACPVKQQCKAFAGGRQSEFPGRKPKSVKPSRDCQFFLVTNPQGECLLEQRPATGLWGGLWTPPERTPQTTTAEFLREWGLAKGDVLSEHRAPAFRHTFSHYHLNIEPVYLTVSREPGGNRGVHERTTWRWVHPAQIASAPANSSIGLPAPAVKLLASLSAPPLLASTTKSSSSK